MTRLFLLLLAACSDSSTAETAAPPAVKCSAEQGVRCDCDTRESPSGQEGVACSAASIGSPSLCCADESFASSKTGGCSCLAFACERAGAGCRCGPVTATTAERVTACAANPGEQCCVDAKKRRCVCGAEPCDGTVVPDCTIERFEKTCETQFTTYRAMVQSCRD